MKSIIYNEQYGDCPINDEPTCLEIKYVGLRVLGKRNEVFKKSHFICPKIIDGYQCHFQNDCPLYLCAPIEIE